MGTKKKMYEDKYIKIEHLLKKPKTDVYEVISKCSNCRIGIIHWYPAWRHYTYEPDIEYMTELSDRCLLTIGLFVMKLNILHKGKGNFYDAVDEFMDNNILEILNDLKNVEK